MAICSTEKRNSEGADLRTKAMDPAAPEAAKNNCMKKTPRPVPLFRSFPKKEVKTVAPNTVMTEISGSDYRRGYVIT
jgi:hypothetical protein